MKMRFIKRMITMTITVAVAVVSLNLIGGLGEGVLAKGKNKGNDDGVLKFAVLSDTHVGPNKERENKRLAELFGKLYNMEPNIDAVSIVGDITDNGSKEQYDKFKGIIGENKREETELVVSMGNHEGNTPGLFKEATGNNPRDNKVIDGYHFITLSARSSENVYGGSRYNLDEVWLKEQLDIATKEDSKKPIFLFLHHGIENTAYGTDEWYTKDLKELISKYPQVVQFGGHSHYPLNDPRSIYQKDFTGINTSTTSYFELESGMHYGTIPPNANNAFQTMLLEVKGTVVKIKKLDLLSGKTIGEDWVFDTSKGKEGFVYTDERKEKSSKPYFENNAKIEVKNIGENQCTVTIDQGKIEDKKGDNHDEIVHSYKYDFIEKRTGKIYKSYKAWSEFYFLPTGEQLTQNFSGLKAGTEYELKVTAINSYNKTSDTVLSTSFKTAGEGFVPPTEEEMAKPIKEAELLNIDFADGTAGDISENKNKSEIKGNPKIEYDKDLKKNIAKFNGESAYKYPFSDSNYNKIKNNISMEGIFKIDKISGTSVNPFSNMESAGLGFEVAKISSDNENAVMEFWVRVRNGVLGTGTYHKVTGNIKYGEYNHVVGTYDGKNINLYINGELENSKAIAGEVYYPTGNAKAFFVGADTNGNGEIQNPMIGDVALARLYSRALTSTEAYKLNKNELQDKVEETSVILNDIENISGKVGTEINLPIVLSSIPKNKSIKSVEMDFDIPKDLSVSSVDIDSSVIKSENFDYNLVDGKLRVALTNTSGKEIFASRDGGNKTIGTIKLKLKNKKENGDKLTIRNNSFILRCDKNEDIVYNNKNAISNLSFLSEEEKKVVVKELYKSSKEEVIPEGYTAYALEFIGIEKDSIISNKTLDNMYYSPDFTNKNNKLTYVTLVKNNLPKETIEKLDNYEIKNGKPGDEITLNFGDINNDGIDAQDALGAVSSWLRKIKPNAKDMLSINVSGDGLINTRDAINIVDNFISDKEFGILEK